MIRAPISRLFGPSNIAAVRAVDLKPPSWLTSAWRDCASVRAKRPHGPGRGGWLLDGFPRTKVQAEALLHGLDPECLIVLRVPDDLLIERVVGRRMDPHTGALYHMEYMPPPDCKEVRGRLVQRADDTKEKTILRLEEFHKHFNEVLDVMSSRRGICVIEVDATESPRQILKEISARVPQTQEPRKFVIAGAPASGKGTQSAMLRGRFGLRHVSTGDLLRAAVAAKTPLGLRVKELMDSGRLIPDAVVIDVVQEQLKQ